MSNRDAFLVMITKSEGTADNPLTVCGGYDVIVTGVGGEPEVFTDFSDHPFAKGRAPKAVNHSGLYSTASGGLQFMLKNWQYYKAMLRLPDFSVESQKLWGLQLIKERGALQMIDAGDLDGAILRCANLWASFPTADYPGQRTNKMQQMHDWFTQAGGVINGGTS